MIHGRAHFEVMRLGFLLLLLLLLLVWLCFLSFVVHAILRPNLGVKEKISGMDKAKFRWRRVAGTHVVPRWSGTWVEVFFSEKKKKNPALFPYQRRSVRFTYEIITLRGRTRSKRPKQQQQQKWIEVYCVGGRKKVELHKSSLYIDVNLWCVHCPTFYREPWTWEHVENHHC